MYIIKRPAHLVVDAKNDNAGFDLLCDYMTASFVIQSLFYPGAEWCYSGQDQTAADKPLHRW